jgi:hypothetical protein
MTPCELTLAYIGFAAFFAVTFALKVWLLFRFM